MKSLLEPFCLVGGMLLLGSCNTMIQKLMFQTDCRNRDGKQHLFNKPWLSTLGMFTGEACLLLFFHLQKRCCRSQRSRANRPTIPADIPAYVFAIPACCDVLGTGIAAAGMVFVDAAVWQMMRGSIIIFGTLFSVCFLERQLKMYHWLGVAITTIGLTLVGAAAVLEDTGGSRQSDMKGGAAVGIALVVLAQVFQSFQNVYEEHVLLRYEVSVLQTVGIEGLWGCFLMAGVLLSLTTVPGSDHGVYESLPDGIHMIGSSAMLKILMFTYVLLIANYNVLGMIVCKRMTAVTRVLIDSQRTLVVWICQLVLFYGVSKQYGHPWTEYSWLQVVGFLLVTAGTLVYNSILKLPGQNYGNDKFEFSQIDVPAKAVQTLQTPTLSRASLGFGSQFGPFSPTSPVSPKSPFIPKLASTLESNSHECAFIIMEEEAK